MFKNVKPKRTVQATLSTGTVISVSHAISNEQEDAWCATLTATDGETMEFGLSHEAFQTFVGAVVKLYAEDAGIKLN